MLLALIEESCHDVGLSMLQHLAWERDIACRRLPMGTSGDEISAYVQDLQPQLVGLSVSLVETIPSALHYARELSKKLGPGVELVLGGHAFRRADGPDLPADLTILTTIDQYIERLDRLGNATVSANDTPRASR